MDNKRSFCINMNTFLSSSKLHFNITTKNPKHFDMKRLLCSYVSAKAFIIWASIEQKQWKINSNAIKPNYWKHGTFPLPCTFGIYFSITTYPQELPCAGISSTISTSPFGTRSSPWTHQIHFSGIVSIWKLLQLLNLLKFLKFICYLLRESKVRNQFSSRVRGLRLRPSELARTAPEGTNKKSTFPLIPMEMELKSLSRSGCLRFFFISRVERFAPFIVHVGVLHLFHFQSSVVVRSLTFHTFSRRGNSKYLPKEKSFGWHSLCIVPSVVVRGKSCAGWKKSRTWNCFFFSSNRRRWSLGQRY